MYTEKQTTLWLETGSNQRLSTTIIRSLTMQSDELCQSHSYCLTQSQFTVLIIIQHSCYSKKELFNFSILIRNISSTRLSMAIQNQQPSQILANNKKKNICIEDSCTICICLLCIYPVPNTAFLKFPQPSINILHIFIYFYNTHVLILYTIFITRTLFFSEQKLYNF